MISSLPARNQPKQQRTVDLQTFPTLRAAVEPPPQQRILSGISATSMPQLLRRRRMANLQTLETSQDPAVQRRRQHRRPCHGRQLRSLIRLRLHHLPGRTSLLPVLVRHPLRMISWVSVHRRKRTTTCSVSTVQPRRPELRVIRLQQLHLHLMPSMPRHRPAELVAVQAQQLLSTLSVT